MGLKSIFTITKVLLALILIIFLINLILRNLNKLNKNRVRAIKVIEKESLDANTSLYIVEILNKYYLISSSQAGEQIVKELDRELMENRLKEIEEYRESMVDNMSMGDFFRRKEDND